MALQRQSAQENQFLSSETKESFIAPGLTIEGKIEGTGNVHVAGRFKGEVSVKGDLTIERGAHISGEIRAENIVVRGEVEGNIHAKARVELSESGVLTGDLKASSLTVTAGSRMRGKVEFGWDEGEAHKVVSIEGVASGL
jgi:cytoskeletal protein CcmA (bactofilin family)